ncbi:MAG: tRNA 2-thiouridine(34) synthase MnmA [Clostridia bacterium]|nr:tRNA 2-thiouridine(34) synthase MnmA [Clostridia bacterium]
MNDNRVVLGLSGGVDSAVAANLLKQSGYEVFGCFLYIGDEAARSDAVKAAESLDVPLSVIDIREQLEENVCKPFTACYLRGETPNPCIMCNPTVKFKNLVEEADRLDAKWVATGHYARTEDGKLFKGRPANDQSYMLGRVRRSQVERLLLPLGNYEKTEVRALAESFGLHVAHKPDSMEICFIPDKDYIGWMSRRAAMPPAGNVTFRGKVIMPHPGIHHYTVGQRLPGLYEERKIYVTAIDPEKNEIIAGLWEDLFRTEVHAGQVNWLIDRPTEPIRASVRVRHTKWENPNCTVTADGDSVTIICDDPVRAPAMGQSAVLYQDDRVIASGYIDRPIVIEA